VSVHKAVDIIGKVDTTILHEEVEKRYLAYALSTIVSRALPDVRDGLKPVHRRILYAMHGMRLGDAARMRKSAAVVGEVIGKYHPHGDQAAYDALVRMAQDFSLRYPLIEGSGNFGSVDGDSPAAMRYTETKLSAFAGLLLREIDQGTTEFRPTYDGMGEEPLVLPAAVPNLLLNGSSGIAVGMSCSFPPHNLGEIVLGCLAKIENPELDTRGLLEFIKGPDFPTGAEILETAEHLHEIYSTGHGAIKVRGTYTTENMGRGRKNIIVTSIPYTVNKSRLIERIAMLIRDKKLKQVHDVRDESTTDVRIVLELKTGDTNTDAVMAFLYRHSDLQINFPVNFISITPQGVPDRMGLDKIIGHFLEFRYEKTVQRLEFRLANLKKRIHVLEGFEILFIDLDQALAIIRAARTREEAEKGLMSEFGLDAEQVNAILEMRLYKLVGLEIGKIEEELAAKRKEAEGITRDLESPKRLWKIIDKELTEIAAKFGDARRTAIVEGEASATEYDPEEFVEHEDASVIVSVQGWIRRIKSEIEEEKSLKFREDDGLMTWVRVNTSRAVSIITNLGKLYVLRVLDIPATSGFGEPLSNIFNFADGECVVVVIAPDPVRPERDDSAGRWDTKDDTDQPDLFTNLEEPASPPSPAAVSRGILITKRGQGFRFDYSILREPTKRLGRRLVLLKPEDEVIAVKSEDRQLVAVAADSGNMLVFPVEQIPTLSGAAQGVRIIRLPEQAYVVAMEPVDDNDELSIKTKRNRTKTVRIAPALVGKRDTKGKEIAPSGIIEMNRVEKGMGRV
jgi:DNA gyrase/topoisomerase IV subunit A